MRYATIGQDSDVHVFGNQQQYTCFACSLMPLAQSIYGEYHLDYTAASGSVMSKHLRQHLVRGDRVPFSTLSNIQKEI